MKYAIPGALLLAILIGAAWLFSWAINTAAQEEEKEYSGLIEED